MPTVYEHDLRWFIQHPTAYWYQRHPLPTEWPDWPSHLTPSSPYI
jgi:hypothetical protein